MAELAAGLKEEEMEGLNKEAFYRNDFMDLQNFYF